MGDPLDEAGWLARARQGDTKAFDELITRHRERIYMHAYHMLRSEDDAVEIAQETFIRAWKSLARFDGKASLSSWLYRIATNAVIDLCRRCRIPISSTAACSRKSSAWIASRPPLRVFPCGGFSGPAPQR